MVLPEAVREVIREMPADLRHHSRAVAALAAQLARRGGLNPRQAALAGYLHDIGKMRIHLELWSSSRRLSVLDREVVRAHPSVGAVFLAEAGLEDPVVIRAVQEHHERVDGAGYPFGRQGAQLSPLGRLLAVADAFVALNEPRPWRPGKPAAAALRLMAAGDAGGALDPYWLDLLPELVEEAEARHDRAAGLRPGAWGLAAGAS